MIAVIVMAVLVMIFVWYLQYHDRLLYGLPQLQWMTIEDVTKAGHPWLASSSWLPVFRARKQLAIRARTDTGILLLERYAPARAFCMRTIHHFEFKLIDGPSRRRKLHSTPLFQPMR